MMRLNGHGNGCKVLMLNFPTNPTGGTADREKLERLAKFAVDKDLIVISDEIYAELTYEGDHLSIASFPGMQDRTIFTWIVQGLRHDWFSGRVCMWSGLVN